MPVSPFGPVPLTPTAFLSRAAVVHRGRLALVDGDVRRTYDELPTAASGSPAGSLNTRLSAVELACIVGHAGSKVLVVVVVVVVVVVDVDLADLGRQVLAELDGDVRLVVSGGPKDDDEQLVEGRRRCRFRSRTSCRCCRSTTRAAPRAVPRASCTPTAVPTWRRWRWPRRRG